MKVPASTMLGEEGRGLDVAQTFVHENRIRQAASSLGAAQYCIDMSVAYAKNRKVFGKALATNQAIQFPLAELHTEAEMTRGLVRKTAWHLDREHHMNVSEWVAMSNYRANRLVCDAADRAIQVHGGIGYSRHTPFEHIYRHHRRYRITEGSEEIQIRRVAGALFGFWGAQKASTGAQTMTPEARRRWTGEARDVGDHPADGIELSLRQGSARDHEPAALQRLALRHRRPVPVRRAGADAPADRPAAARLAADDPAVGGGRRRCSRPAGGSAWRARAPSDRLDRDDHDDRLLRDPGLDRRTPPAGARLGSASSSPSPASCWW